MRGCVYFGRSCQEGVRDCRGATHDYEARSPSAHKDFRIWDGMGWDGIDTGRRLGDKILA